ncbi:hypothetical protein KSS87_019960 [Heliosperma pusillum]|nr:hypothetical protein KSS87_019960 [Heliosperma pusillum]
MMDSNGCDTNHLDADVRLPPRKRLLAGLKKQSCLESTSQCSQENSSSPSLSPSLNASICQSPLSEFDLRLNDLLKSYKNGPNMSPEEIAIAAESAACTAARSAEAARAVAEEKAAIAAKAVAAAKTALDLVALGSEETSSRGKHQKRNKLKKHVPVELLYNKYSPIENCGADEELAMRLHRTMNSSPRISKHSPGSDSGSHKHKKLKVSSPNDKSGISNGTNVTDDDVKLPSECNGHGKGVMEIEKSNEKVSKCSKDDELEVNSGEGESSQPPEKKFEGYDDLCVNGRKRGRIKQKKLPLNVLSSKDQANPKEELIIRARTDKSTSRQLASSDNVSPMDVAPTWKCHDFKVSQCIKQDKLVQS